MSPHFFDRIPCIFFLIIVLTIASSSHAHDAGATMDPNGNVASFTGFAQVSCTNSGSVPTDHLVASIKDTSPPQDNLLVNLQVIHVDNNINRANSTTDAVSGDANFSPEVRVPGGNGTYLLLVNKTGAGARSFIVSYHCMAVDGVTHTDTDILVYQFE